MRMSSEHFRNMKETRRDDENGAGPGLGDGVRLRSLGQETGVI
jgi:hypothetical protein